MPALDPTHGRALYRQLADELRARIDGGEWVPGQTLPAEFDLGQEFGISTVTVRRALVLLKSEGYIEGRRGRLARVRHRGEVEVVELQPGDRVTARRATQDDQKEYAIPEDVFIVVVTAADGTATAHRADEVEFRVPGNGAAPGIPEGCSSP